MTDKDCCVSHRIFVEKRTIILTKWRRPEINSNYNDKYLFVCYHYYDFRAFSPKKLIRHKLLIRKDIRTNVTSIFRTVIKFYKQNTF